jgi:hypothetical protein
MKITLDGASVMKLRDNNFTGFMMGAVFFLAGVGVAVLMSSEIFLIAFGALFAIVGLYLILTTKIVNVVLDKGSGKFSYSLSGIAGGGKRELELKRITGLTLQKTTTTSHSSKGGSSTHYNYFLNFMTDANEEMSVELGSVQAGITDVLVSPDERMRKEAKRVADFIGVQLKEAWPPSMGEMMGMIKSSIDSQMAERQKP